MWRLSACWRVGLWGLAACTRPPVWHDLVDNTQWMLVSGEDDPWDPLRPDDISRCGETELTLEPIGDEVWLDVLTETCAHVTLTQPLAHDVPRGAILRTRIWHFAITAWQDTFQLAYQIGLEGGPEWQRSQVVPAESALIQDEWVTSRAYRAGEPVYFHLSNHGDNSWSLIEFSGWFPPRGGGLHTTTGSSTAGEGSERSDALGLGL